MEFGIQLSSVTPYMQTEKDLRETLQKLAAIGYRTVQAQGVPYSIPDKALAAALRDAGLACVAMQEDFPFAQPAQRVVERAAACGCRYLTFALFPLQIGDVYHLEHVARELEEVHRLAEKNHLIFSFHPLGRDFRLMDGEPLYKRLLAMLPGSAQLTYCVCNSLGFAEPEQVLQAYAGRVDLVHFKDRRKMSGSREMLMPLGEGEVDWAPIAAACEKAGAKYIFAEQERWNRGAFDCAAASFRYLEGLGPLLRGSAA